jgi:hypothetical protein
VALWWTVYGDSSRPDPFHDALTPVVRRLTPELVDVAETGGADAPPPYALDAEARIAEIEQCGHFGPAYHETIAWTGRHSTAEIRALFASYSPWLALPPGRRVRVLDALEQVAEDDFGGIVERPYVTSIYTAATRSGRRSRRPGSPRDAS